MKINDKDYTEEEIRKIISENLSKSDVLKAFGNNGRVWSIIDDIIKIYNISIEHFDPLITQKLRAKYKKIIKICPICSKEFKTQLNHPREKTTCSSKCSNTYFSYSKHTELSNLKRSLKLKKDDTDKK